MSQITGPPPLQPVPPPAPPAAAHRAWYRRPVLVVPLMLVVAAAVAAALFLPLRPSTITARGTVIDSLTGQPLTAASLHGGGKAATTDARGKFQITGIAANTTLLVRARYYASAQAKAALAPTLSTMRAQLREWYRTRHYQATIDWMLSRGTGYTLTAQTERPWYPGRKTLGPLRNRGVTLLRDTGQRGM